MAVMGWACAASGKVALEHGADQALAAQLKDVAEHQVHAVAAVGGQGGGGHVHPAAVAVGVFRASGQVDAFVAVEDEAHLDALGRSLVLKVAAST